MQHFKYESNSITCLLLVCTKDNETKHILTHAFLDKSAAFFEGDKSEESSVAVYVRQWH